MDMYPEVDYIGLYTFSQFHKASVGAENLTFNFSWSLSWSVQGYVFFPQVQQSQAALYMCLCMVCKGLQKPSTEVLITVWRGNVDYQ